MATDRKTAKHDIHYARKAESKYRKQDVILLVCKREFSNPTSSADTWNEIK